MKNILLITVDCLRPDHMSLYGYKRETTPFIDKLASKGVVFTRAFATGSSTPFSFPGIFSSTYPLDFSTVPSMKHPLRQSITTILKQNGYLTAGFHSNVYVSSFYGYERDFDFYFDLSEKKAESRGEIKPSLARKIIRSIPLISGIARKVYRKYYFYKRRKQEDLAYVRGDKTTDKVVKWLQDLDEDKPIFLWVHYMDPHHPYLSTDQMSEWNDKTVESSVSFKFMRKYTSAPQRMTLDEINLIKDLYDGEIKFADSEIEKLVSHWNKKYKESTIIITADHGDEFREHGEFSHKAKLYDELIHVPMIILDPLLEQALNEDLISQIDLPTTVLGLQKIDLGSYMKGHDIFSKNYTARDYVISETLRKENKVSMDGEGNQLVSIRGKRWKYISESLGNEELYNLEEDPQEQLNLISEKKELAEELSKLVSLHLKKQSKSRIKI